MPTPWIVCGPSNHSISAAVADAQPGLVEEPDLGELVRHVLVGADAVEVTPFDHERPRRDQGGHLGVVERAAQVELEDLVLAGPDVAVRARGRGVLPRPTR